MRHYYKIDDELMEKGRTYLINQCDRADHLSPDEENAIMMKFNEDLRNSNTFLIKKYIWKTLYLSLKVLFYSCADGQNVCNQRFRLDYNTFSLLLNKSYINLSENNVFI